MNVEMDRRLLGRRIKAARIMAGITQRELATITGIKLNMIKEYEQGRCNPSMERLLIIMSVVPFDLDGLAVPA